MNALKFNWITNGTDRPFYARKTFRLTELPAKAEVAVSGLGQFILYINGRKVSDHVLDPAWTDYRKLIDYLVFDVTDMLLPGENVIAAEIGNGWFIMDEADGNYSFHFPPFMPPNPNPYRPFSSVLMFFAHLEMTTSSGAVTSLDTDDTWLVRPSMTCRSNVFGSETMDGRLRDDTWNKACPADPSVWTEARYVSPEELPAGKPDLQTIPPVKVIRTYPARFLGQVNGRLIYDLGQNIAGMLELDVRGKAGDVIRILPAEKLGPDGDVDQMAKGWMMIDVCETYVIGRSDVWEHVEMKFTYFGGRFLAIEGCSPDAVRDFRAHAITSAWEKAGEIACDDERFMKIYDMIEKSVEANMLGVHTDCPTIERFAWQEENHMMVPSVMYMKQVKEHFRKFFKDTRAAQHTADDVFRDFAGNEFHPGDGLVPAQAPCYIPNVLPVPGMGSFYDIIAWGSSLIIGVWHHYTFYGDKSILTENYDAGRRYFAYLETKKDANGFISHGLGDWGNPNPADLARENVETAFLFADAKLLSQMAEALGRPEDAALYAGKAEAIRAHYNKMLLTKDPGTGLAAYRIFGEDGFRMTQACEALPLYWGIVPEDVRGEVLESFRNTLTAAGSFVAGEVSQPYIIQTMAMNGMNDLICRFILREDHPSYYAFILDGETTLGEYWETNPRSHCHDMMGHIAEWYYDGIAGIRPLAPGFAEVLVKPYLPTSMNHFACTYRSASGDIRVAMVREGGKVRLTCTAAEGIGLKVDESYLH